MNAETLGSSNLPYNRNMFRWAREWRQRTQEEAAKKLSTTTENVRAWESGEAVPTVRQARQLADYYGRSFIEFFLPEPPSLIESALVPDYRLHSQAPSPRDNRELKGIQDWAEEARLNALDLYEMLGDEPPKVPPSLYADLADDPERAARLARKESGFEIEHQLSLTSSEQASLPKLIRQALERLGVLVLKDSSLGKYGVRGLCVVTAPLPVIVFGSEAPAAQAFTISHELGHVLLQQSAIIPPMSSKNIDKSHKEVEDWCNQFAAAFLIPTDAVGRMLAKPNAPVSALSDTKLAKLAKTFRVSRHAMLIRLVHLGYVEARFYWDVKRPVFLIQEAQYKTGGKPKYYGSRYRSARGDLYTGLVLEAWSNGYITNHNAAEFMGIKNLTHLEDIRDEFRAA